MIVVILIGVIITCCCFAFLFIKIIFQRPSLIALLMLVASWYNRGMMIFLSAFLYFILSSLL